MLIALLLVGSLQSDPEPRLDPELARPDFVAAPAPGCFNFLAVDPFDSNVLFGYSGAAGDLHRSDDGGLSWTDLAGPPQSIVSLAVSRTDPRRIFAVADGFYVSGDRGASWSRSLSAPADLAGKLVFDPFSPEPIYVASNSFRSGRYVGELWFSPDEGAHWLRRESGLPVGPGSPFSDLVASPHEPGVLLVGTLNGLYATRDGGDHWEPRSADVVFPLGFDAASAEIVWGWYLNSLFLSQDGGATWQPRTVDCCPGTGDQTSLLRIVPDPIAPGVAWALVEAEFPGSFFADHVLRTADYGATWQWAGGGIDGTSPAALRELILSADGQTVWVTDCGRSAVYRRDLRRARTLPPR